MFVDERQVTLAETLYSSVVVLRKDNSENLDLANDEHQEANTASTSLLIKDFGQV